MSDRRHGVRSAVAESLAELHWIDASELRISTDADIIMSCDWDDYVDVRESFDRPQPLVVPFMDGVKMR